MDQTTTLRISAELHKRIKLIAVLDDLTIQDATERIVQAGLDAIHPPPPSQPAAVTSQQL